MQARDTIGEKTPLFLGHDCFLSWRGKKKSQYGFFCVKISGGGDVGGEEEEGEGGAGCEGVFGGGERCAAARLDSSLCQGYKQAVIRPPNRIILPVSAPKHMGPHKAAAAPDRHPLLITQRRGAGPLCLRHSRPCLTFSLRLAVEEKKKERERREGGGSHVALNKARRLNCSSFARCEPFRYLRLKRHAIGRRIYSADKKTFCCYSDNRLHVSAISAAR